MTLTQINVGECPTHGAVIADGHTCPVLMQGGGIAPCGLSFKAQASYVAVDALLSDEAIDAASASVMEPGAAHVAIEGAINHVTSTGSQRDA